jgi:hypothetical protein
MTAPSLEDYERAFERGIFARQPPEGPEELLLYRDMARRRLRDAIEYALPRTMRIVGEPVVDAQIELFLEHGPTTLFLYRVGAEFSSWVLKNKPEWSVHARDALSIDVEVLTVANA